MLNEWSLADEPRTRRVAFFILALASAAAFLWINAQFLVPAHGGVDQNGYLVGGRYLAEHGSMALHPVNPLTGAADPFLFVGRMWVGIDLNTPGERYYPKYPLGLPALVALAWKLGGPTLAYWISPLCMTFALLAVFLIARAVAGSFLGWIAMLLIGTSPITLSLTDNPNSHASTLFMVTWGMVLLFDWSRRGGQWRALAAGLLIGYAATIRYTEGLLVLPILLAAWWRFRDVPADRTVFLLPAAWNLPILTLVAHNRWAFGSWTGYDPCNESTGFAWAFFRDNWDTMLHQLGGVGLIFFFPLGLAGLVFMLWHARRLGLFMAAWILPNVLTYTFYYWAPDGLGYLRFFLTVLPPLAVCGLWLLHVLGEGLTAARPGHPPPHRHPSVFIAAGVLAILTAGANLDSAASALGNDLLSRDALRRRVNDILAEAPAGSVLFAQDDSLLHCLQFHGALVLYSQGIFDRKAVEALPAINLTSPQGLQPQRSLALRERFGKLTQPQLTQQQRRIAEEALAAGHRVFALRRGEPALRKPADKPARPAASKASAAPPVWFVPGAFPAAQFRQTVVCSWSDGPGMPGKPAPAKPRGRKPDVPRPDNRTGATWWLVEITAQPPTAPAASHPR